MQVNLNFGVQVGISMKFYFLNIFVMKELYGYLMVVHFRDLIWNNWALPELFYFLSQKYISNILFNQVRFYDQLFFWFRYEEKRRIVISLTDTEEDSSQNNEDKNAFENGKTFDIAYNNQDIDNPRRSLSIINADSSLSLLALPVLLGFQLFWHWHATL